MKKDNKATKKALIVTDKQLKVIKEACELYGRIQIGQFRMIAEIITQTGFSGAGLRIDPKRQAEETEEKYEARKSRLYDDDLIISKNIEGAIEGIYRRLSSYSNDYNYKAKPNEADVALDIWAVLDGRREDGFHMGSEPLVEVQNGDGKLL